MHFILFRTDLRTSTKKREEPNAHPRVGSLPQKFNRSKVSESPGLGNFRSLLSALVILNGLLLASAAFVKATPPVFAPPTWSDEFNGTGPPNPAVWTFEQGFVRNQELQWYQSNNAWQQNGNLIIEGRREQVPNPNYLAGSTDWKRNRQFAQYTSSSITSQGKFSFQYGRMQVRAKIPCFSGTWPAIWTLGDAGEWPSNGECDVLEYYSPDSVLANLARGTNTRWSAAWDAVKKPVSPFFTTTNPNPNWRTEYHIWTMQWDEENIRLYIDNYLMNTTAQTWLVNSVTTWGPKNPFKQPHHLLLNLALGGAGGNPANTPFPLRYEVDHVRVWEGLTGNNAPTDIALSSNSVPEGLPSGTVVGNLTATDVDAAEVHSFSLVSGTGSTHNASFEIIFNSDQTKTSVLRTKTVLRSADGATRSIRVRVTDIEGATHDKVLTIQLDGQFVIEVNPATLSVPEGGSATFNVRLRVAPYQTTMVNLSRLSGDADLTLVSVSQLVFTPANGTLWQTVTLAAAQDIDRTNGAATFLCNDPSGNFLSATVLATESDSEPILDAAIALANLSQTYDGNAKSVIVTTTPTGLSHDLTYGGQFMRPSDAGTYEIVAIITDPDYQGSVAGTLEIAKAAQTIHFDALGTLPDDAAPMTLAATAGSGLAVSFTSSDTKVALLSGSTLTIAGPGTTTITASQGGNDNFNAAAVPQVLTVSRVNPLAVISGHYLLLPSQSLALSAADSHPSSGQTLSNYAWDLNHDGAFGDIMGVTPTPIPFADLVTLWGMTDGFNPIALRVTDSSGKISTVSSTVQLVGNLTWDANGAAALRTDGAGDWTAANPWWDGVTNVPWASGDDAIFGNGGTGGAVALARPTTVHSITFNSFSGTYTLGTVGQTITLKNGIIKNASADGQATIISPVRLSASQNWTNDSAGMLAIGPDAVSNDGFLLSVGGTGNTAISGAISGTSGLTKIGAGTLNLTGTSAYAGATAVNDGTLILSSANTIRGATTVAATGTLQLGHATSMGASTLTLASGARLQLRNDTHTTFTAPIATPASPVTYNFEVNNAGSMATDMTLVLGNLTFAANFSGSVTNRINVTGGSRYALRMGTLTTPSGGGSAHPLVINTTSAAIVISRVTTGSYGTALTFIGTNKATLGSFELGSNGNQSIIVNGPTVTLGSTVATNNRTSATVAYTLTGGVLNLTTPSSIANARNGGTSLAPAPTFLISGGTLNNTNGAPLSAVAATQTLNNNPLITMGGDFAFGTSSSTSANNLNLGTGAITNSGNRTITLNGTDTRLTLGGAMTNGISGTQTTTVNGVGNTLALGSYNLSSSATSRTGIFTGTGNVVLMGPIFNGSTSTAGILTKNGSGTLTLEGANTYGGATNVSAGRLLVNGSLVATSTVAVTGGTLGGAGTISGNVTVASVANLAPGASAGTAGTLNIGGVLNLSALANGGVGKLNFDIGPIATSDKIALTGSGSLTIGVGFLGFNDFNLSALDGLENGVYKLITSPNPISGSLDTNPLNLTGPVGSGTGILRITAKDVELVVSGIDRSSAPVTYSIWASVHAPSDDPDEDFDGDGVANAVEFVLGGLATTNDRGKLPLLTTNGTDMTFTFVRDQASIAPAAAAGIEVGTTLGSWPDHFTVGTDTAGSSPGVVVTQNSPSAGKDSVTLTVPHTPVAAKFARLKVTVIP